MAAKGKKGPKPTQRDLRLATAIAAALEPHLVSIGTRIDSLQTELRTGLDGLGKRFDNSFATSGELVRDLRRRVEELERRP